MAKPTYEELLGSVAERDRIIVEKDRRIGELEARVARLETLVQTLTRELEEARRAGKRQAAPFAKPSPKPDPKPPGRKPGETYGPKAHRPVPPEKPDEIIDVPLPRSCPDCGGAVHEERIEHQFQVEIPRRPLHRRFDLHVGRCRRCGKRIQPRHQQQTSDALGAAASQVGPDAQAMTAMLKDKYGLSYGDIRGVFADFFGIGLSRGGAAQVVLRAGKRAEPAHRAILALVRGSRVVYADETGWRVEALLEWLWDFVSLEARAVAYVIRPSRGFEVLKEVLGPDWSGRLNHDGWAPYDKLERAQHQQCLAHPIRRARELIEAGVGRALAFPRRVKALLQDALALRDREQRGEVSEHGGLVAAGRLEARFDRLLESHPTQEANRRFRDHLARHREEWFTFLYYPEVEATNWPAEQAIRPAVVNRKVFGGNRTESGARAQEVLGSLFATCARRAQDALEFLSRLLCLRPAGRPACVQAFLQTSGP